MALPVFKTGCSPLCGKAGFDPQALPPTFAHDCRRRLPTIALRSNAAVGHRCSRTGYGCRPFAHACHKSVSCGWQAKVNSQRLSLVQLPTPKTAKFGGWELGIGSWEFAGSVLRVCSAPSARRAAPTASAATTRGLFARKGKRQELRPGTGGPSHSDDHKLPALMHVRHRQTRLRTRSRRLPDLGAGRLVVGVEERLPSRAFTGEQQRLGDEQSRPVTGCRSSEWSDP